MKTYKVTYVEKLIHTFYVEANNEKEAEEIFREKSMACEFDFSDGVVDDTEYIIEEDDEDEWEKPEWDEEEDEIDRSYHDASEDELRKMGAFDNLSEDEDYIPSAENGDYSPSNPWDAPGMSIKDFI